MNIILHPLTVCRHHHPAHTLVPGQWVPYTLLTEVNGTMTVGGPMGKLLDSFSKIFSVE